MSWATASHGYIIVWALQAILAAYVYWCVRRGFVWLRSERVERKKNPTKFKIVLGGYIVFSAGLFVFTLYQLLVVENP